MGDSTKASVEMEFFALCVLGFLEDLFTASPKEIFSRDEVLSVLNHVKNNPLFDPEAVIFYDMIDAGDPEKR